MTPLLVVVLGVVADGIDVVDAGRPDCAGAQAMTNNNAPSSASFMIDSPLKVTDPLSWSVDALACCR
jgi:hypothetical protein